MPKQLQSAEVNKLDNNECWRVVAGKQVQSKGPSVSAAGVEEVVLVVAAALVAVAVVEEVVVVVVVVVAVVVVVVVVGIIAVVAVRVVALPLSANPTGEDVCSKGVACCRLAPGAGWPSLGVSHLAADLQALCAAGGSGRVQTGRWLHLPTCPRNWFGGLGAFLGFIYIYI
ncbi:CEP104 [Symbiodinium sp. CCMP2456]|nr:CEP104 [Symbiodinium sp. CCMP2456]